MLRVTVRSGSVTVGGPLKGAHPQGVTRPDNPKEEEGVTRDISGNPDSRDSLQALDSVTGRVADAT